MLHAEVLQCTWIYRSQANSNVCWRISHDYTYLIQHKSRTLCWPGLNLQPPWICRKKRAGHGSFDQFSEPSLLYIRYGLRRIPKAECERSACSVWTLDAVCSSVQLELSRRVGEHEASENRLRPNNMSYFCNKIKKVIKPGRHGQLFLYAI